MHSYTDKKIKRENKVNGKAAKWKICRFFIIRIYDSSEYTEMTHGNEKIDYIRLCE